MTDVDARIPGKDTGINVENSNVCYLANRGNGVRQSEFGGDYWYDRGGDAGYAINGQDTIVRDTANVISSSLPEGRSDNAYAFSAATFDYLRLRFLRPQRTRTSPVRTRLFDGRYGGL